MIQPENFWRMWETLCTRFGREADREEAALYLEYMEDMGMEEDQVERAARVVWASREFFPRPLDFVLAAHSDLLGKLRRAAMDYRTSEAAGWLTIVGGRPSLGLEVVRALGGIEQVAKMVDRGPDTFRREVEAHLDHVLAEMMTDTLPALGGPSGEVGTLPAATRED